MKQMIRGFALAGLALALVLVAGAAVAGEGGTWVEKSGKVHQLEHGNAMFVTEDGAERFNLSELRDGETRTFGAGPRAVTASRSGDTVTISRSESGDDVDEINVTCAIGQDNCTVVTFPDDAEKVMIAIEKERTCINGEGDCDDFTFGHGDIGGIGHIVVDIDCEGDDCAELHELELGELHHALSVETTADGEGEPSRIVIRRVGDGAGIGSASENVFVTRAGSSAVLGGIHEIHPDQVMLQCTEGDASIRVSKDEADETFLCPKHSTPMEQVKRRIHAPVRVLRKGTPHEH